VALCADKILLRSESRKLLSKAAMGFVAVRAKDKPFHHLVMRRLGELRSLIFMALKAEARLGGEEQISRFVRRVDAMAADAAYIVPAMCCAFKDGMLACMTLQAFSVHLLGSRFRWIEDFRLVSTTLNVRLAGPVAIRASDAWVTRRPTFLTCVRIVDKSFHNFLMAPDARHVLS
jgi:hypothetical protein